MNMLASSLDTLDSDENTTCDLRPAIISLQENYSGIYNEERL
jgi:hypothetical protein